MAGSAAEAANTSAGKAAQSAEAAETAQQSAENAAKKAVEAKTGAENALQDAGTAKEAASGYADAATESATAAAASATNAATSAKSASDAAQKIEDSAEKIDQNAAAVSQLKEDKLNKPEVPVVGELLRVKSISDTGEITLETVAGGGGSGLPEGGTAGQVLGKKSDTDGDVEWKNSLHIADTSTSYDEMRDHFESGLAVRFNDLLFFATAKNDDSKAIYFCNYFTFSGLSNFLSSISYQNGQIRSANRTLYTLPDKGSTGQILAKKSNSSGDTRWVDPQTATVRTTMDDVAVAGAKYFLGEQTELSITMPTDAQTGQEIAVIFSSGETPCTLSIDLDDFDYVPKANTTCKITFTCIDSDTWLVDVKEG